MRRWDLVPLLVVLLGASPVEGAPSAKLETLTLENGLVVEDWSVTDTFGMLRQLGFWRALLIRVQQWRTALN